MRLPKNKGGSPRCLPISRRTFLKSGITFAGTLPLTVSLVGCWEKNNLIPPFPRYILSREVDELFFELAAIGYEEREHWGSRYLEPVKGFLYPHLIFRFPPQHFAETALGVKNLPATVLEQDLAKIGLFPSGTSKLVFRDPHRRRIKLTVEELLNWRTFELALPDLDRLQLESGIDLEVQNPEEGPHDGYIQFISGQAFTQIEMPWGVYLTPLGSYGVPPKVKPGIEGAADRYFAWEHSIDPVRSGNWTELWSTALENTGDGNLANQFEILGVKGFKRSVSFKANPGNLHEPVTTIVTYSDDPYQKLPDWLGCAGNSAGTTSVCNLDRIELALSLSRRFRERFNSGTVFGYESRFNPQKITLNACSEDGRAVSVNEFRLSARGGSLQLDTKWNPFPGCGLKGWKHIATEGRDDEAQLVNEGFLFPFGVEAEVTTRTERVFIKDEKGHFVAVLMKQTFLQIPQPNSIHIEHMETMFRAVSVTTTKTPPLDLPASGDPDDYRHYDFFLPTVDGVPFEFEHVGIDWAGDQHTSKMPMFFVSNAVRSKSNGLIWEAGDAADTSGRQPSTMHPIPTNGDGLRIVDKEWNLQPYRFAHYGSLIAVANPSKKGDTTQKVEWVEWGRGKLPDLKPGEVAERPFQPRVRTMKVQLHGMSQLSGENKFSLVTYRDTRFTKYPVLDPEPNAPALIYGANLPSDPGNESSPYLFVLETRDLLHENSRPSIDDEATTRNRIRTIYYGTSGAASQIPDALFASIDNEIKFGVSGSSETTGGLSVPDTHVSTLTRRYGPVGDATFNAQRWEGYQNKKPTLAAASRVDYAAFRMAYRSHINDEPFDKSQKQSDIDSLQTSAASLMGFGSAPLHVAAVTMHLASASSPAVGGNLNLGDLFGSGAQLLPGLSFKDVFQSVPMRDTSSPRDVTSNAAVPKGADPLQWHFRVTGIDWLLQLIGNGPGQFSFDDILTIAKTQGQSAISSIPVDFGIEAALHWSNDAFNDVTIGPVDFNRIPDKTHIEINAQAKMALGLAALPESLSEIKLDPSKAQISASAELRDFIVVVFGAVEIEFSSVTFTLSPDGRKNLSVNIRDVRLKGSLEFINQLSKILGGLGGDSGMDVDISPARVRISQTLKFPAKEGQPLFIGPAQVTNLAFGWAVMIPLIGRDVLSVSFALSSREKPLTIFVPPWYGGKAHVLMEVTTRGLRLLEVSMEYGAVIPIQWGIATGEASLTAGVFYMMKRTDDGKSGEVIFMAFVKATANLDVAGIIHFCGLVFIALSYRLEGTRKLIVGEATVSVSIKIGFVRFSYSFTATHVEEAQGDNSVARLFVGEMGQTRGGPNALGEEYIFAGADQSTGGTCASTVPAARGSDVQLFGSNMDERRVKAFESIVEGYVS
jgi:hypothetical protein